MSKSSKFVFLLSLILVFALALSACTPDSAPVEVESAEVEEAAPEEAESVEAEPVEAETEPEPTEPPPPTEEPEPTDPPLPTETPLPTLTPTPEVQLSGLSPDPQRVEFQAEDGKNLVGYYFPSEYANAEMVVLVHWAGGNKWDWCEIAPWLQNRQDENPVVLEACEDPAANWGRDMASPWWDPTWFPPMPEDVSFAVFIFDFRDYGESEAGLDSPQEWALDALAAYQRSMVLHGTASTLDFGKVAKPSQMISFSSIWGIGSSIGADAVLDACYMLNEKLGEFICKGFLSLSPGSYLRYDYAEMAKKLLELNPEAKGFCLSAKDDPSATATCNGASEHLSQDINYEKGGHGNMLLDGELTVSVPDLSDAELNALEIIQHFLPGVIEE